MVVAKRLLAILMVALGIVVALTFILTPVYHDGAPQYPIWQILNWFMVAAVLVMLVVGFIRDATRGARSSPPSSTCEAASPTTGPSC